MIDSCYRPSTRAVLHLHLDQVTANPSRVRSWPLVPMEQEQCGRSQRQEAQRLLRTRRHSLYSLHMVLPRQQSKPPHLVKTGQLEQKGMFTVLLSQVESEKVSSNPWLTVKRCRSFFYLARTVLLDVRTKDVRARAGEPAQGVTQIIPSGRSSPTGPCVILISLLTVSWGQGCQDLNPACSASVSEKSFLDT